MPELRPLAERGIDVDDRVRADERARAEGDVTSLDQPRPGAVAADVRVLGDDAARANGQQVGTDRDVLSEDGGAAADPGAERPQVQRVQRRPDEQAGHRIGDDHGLDQPEPEVAEAPGPNAPRLPPADEQPLDRDGEHAEAEQGAAAECHEPRVDVQDAARPEDPGEAGVEQQPRRRRCTRQPSAAEARRTGSNAGYPTAAWPAAGVRYGHAASQAERASRRTAARRSRARAMPPARAPSGTGRCPSSTQTAGRCARGAPR